MTHIIKEAHIKPTLDINAFVFSSAITVSCYNWLFHLMGFFTYKQCFQYYFKALHTYYLNHFFPIVILQGNKGQTKSNPYRSHFLSSRSIIIPAFGVFLLSNVRGHSAPLHSSSNWTGTRSSPSASSRSTSQWRHTSIISCPSLTDDRSWHSISWKVCQFMGGDKIETERVGYVQRPSECVWRGHDIRDGVDCCAFHHLLYNV